MLRRLWEAVLKLLFDLVDPERDVRAQVKELVESVASWEVVRWSEEDLTLIQGIEGISRGRRVHLTFHQFLPEEVWKGQLTLRAFSGDCTETPQATDTNWLFQVYLDGQPIWRGCDYWSWGVWESCCAKIPAGLTKEATWS